MTHVPTDALLHGAPVEETATAEKASVRVEGGVVFLTGASAVEGTIFKREPIYADSDATRQHPLRNLSAEETFQVASIKEVGQELIDLIDTMPLNRELALAKTKVEEAVMWAVKGVTK